MISQRVTMMSFSPLDLSWFRRVTLLMTSRKYDEEGRPNPLPDEMWMHALSFCGRDWFLQDA